MGRSAGKVSASRTLSTTGILFPAVCLNFLPAKDLRSVGWYRREPVEASTIRGLAPFRSLDR